LIPQGIRQSLRLLKAKIQFPDVVLHSGYIQPTVRFGKGCVIHRGVEVHRDARLGNQVALWTNSFVGPSVQIGDFSYLNEGSRIEAGRIGNYCSIGPYVLIGLPEHRLDGLSTSPVLAESLEEDGGLPPPTIGSDVWVGARAIVLRGVIIGDGAVVAAGAVVSRDVAPYGIVAGVPAREIRQRFATEVVEELLRLKWWEWPPKDIARVKAINLREAAAVDQLRALRLLLERSST
jgi:acetyltransferase-like isoleucine patch superfamily enzyme